MQAQILSVSSKQTVWQHNKYVREETPETVRSHVCDKQVCAQVSLGLGFEPNQQIGWESDTGLPSQWANVLTASIKHW